MEGEKRKTKPVRLTPGRHKSFPWEKHQTSVRSRCALGIRCMRSKGSRFNASSCLILIESGISSHCECETRKSSTTGRGGAAWPTRSSFTAAPTPCTCQHREKPNSSSVNGLTDPLEGSWRPPKTPKSLQTHSERCRAVFAAMQKRPARNCICLW